MPLGDAAERVWSVGALHAKNRWVWEVVTYVNQLVESCEPCIETASGSISRLSIGGQVHARTATGGPKWTIDRTIFEMWLGSL